MRRWVGPFVLVLVSMTPASAQVPTPDSRIQTLAWNENAITPLRTAVGSSLTLIFEPGESVAAVVLDTKSAVRVSVSPMRDSLTIESLVPVAENGMTVQTSLRHYRFVLQNGTPQDAVYAVRITGPEPVVIPSSSNVSKPRSSASYRIKGDRTQMPARIEDDGERMYVTWHPDQDLPATFSVNLKGEEETVDSYMRDDVQVIDRVYPALVFRTGKASAKAIRQVMPQAGRVSP